MIIFIYILLFDYFYIYFYKRTFIGGISSTRERLALRVDFFVALPVGIVPACGPGVFAELIFLGFAAGVFAAGVFAAGVSSVAVSSALINSAAIRSSSRLASSLDIWTRSMPSTVVYIPRSSDGTCNNNDHSKLSRKLSNGILLFYSGV